jgi:WD40 repeat protein/tRNA A-37 threonylcarbamoyl transferase component Bud32
MINPVSGSSFDAHIASPLPNDHASQIVPPQPKRLTNADNILHPGTKLAWFHLEQRLTSDAFGERWSGVDRIAELGVTIRVFPRRFSQSEELANRVKQYYRAVRALHHQSVCPLDCLGRDTTAGYFVVMPQSSGSSLSEYCKSRLDKQRRMPFRDAIKLLAQMARALDYIHDRNIAHGDLRPHNILVDEKGNVQLAEIGLTQLAETCDASAAEHNELENRLAFLAPECRRGERAAPKTDQYALAVVAYELLTGELPTIDGCTFFAMVNPEHLAEHVAEAFTKSLSAMRAERFESCTAFVQALIGEDTSGRKAMGVLGANYLNELAAKAKDPNARQQSPAQDNRPTERTEESDVAADENGAKGANAAAGKNSHKTPIDESASRKPRSAIAKFEPIRRLEAHRNGVTTVAFSRDGRFVLSGGKDKDVRLRDAKNARELRSLKGHSDRINGVAFCGDGRRAVSCSDDGTVRLWETDSGRQVHCLNGHRGGVKAVALAPDGESILTGGDDATLRLWDLETGEELRQFGGLFSRHNGAVHGLAITNFGNLAVSGSLDGTVRLWELASARQTTRLLKQKEGINCVCFSADDRLVAAGTQNGKIHIWEVENGNEIFVFDGHQKPVWSVACSPLGGRLLSAGWDGAICLWDLESGRQLNRFTGHTAGVNSLAFSPDGRTAISGGFDGNLQFWSL